MDDTFPKWRLLKGHESMNTTSLTLLQRVKRRDDQPAWERFVRLYTPLLHRWVMRAGFNDLDAADLVQDVFGVLLIEMPRFEFDGTRGPFRAWLKTVTVNKCRESQRRRQPVRAHGGDDGGLPALADDRELEAFWEVEYRSQLVRRAMEIMQQQFEPRLWQCCWEMTVNGLSAAQVGESLGMSEAAVYVAKFRVLRHLRQELRDLLN